MPTSASCCRVLLTRRSTASRIVPRRAVSCSSPPISCITTGSGPTARVCWSSSSNQTGLEGGSGRGSLMVLPGCVTSRWPPSVSMSTEASAGALTAMRAPRADCRVRLKTCLRPVPDKSRSRGCLARRRLLESGRPRVRDVAAMADVHPVYFARVFRRHFRCSAREYRRRQAVMWAAELLSCSDLALANVARTVGFADQSHLCREFRRELRVTPTGIPPSDAARMRLQTFKTLRFGPHKVRP